VSGGLTLLGVTKPLTVNVAVRRETEGGSAQLGFLATTRINRFDFDMTSGFPLGRSRMTRYLTMTQSG
jgi:polyisoprenoid-binding protein YceI